LTRATPPRPRPSLRLAAVLAAAAALIAAGCGEKATSTEGANTAEGKELFTAKCGSCHTLADAGTQGQIGPNLDEAFRYDRKNGFADSTFFEVVLEQMKIPGAPMPEFDDPDDKQNYLTEEQLKNVAAYVASVAGKAGTGGGTSIGTGTDTGGGTGTGAEFDPKASFTQSCGSCHTLSAAGTTGTVGPNLDDLKPSLQAAIEQITNGGGAMPAFKGQLTDAQIKALAQYVVDSTSR
jgi:mono/diheme cytochrome c family protein